MSEYDTVGNKAFTTSISNMPTPEQIRQITTGLPERNMRVIPTPQQIREAVTGESNEFMDVERTSVDEVAVEALGFEGAPPSLDRLMGIASVVLTKFARKHMEYGGRNHEDLGARAQFIDINRKTLKLRAALWDGVDTSLWAEQPEQIAEDLVGHCLLLLDLLRRADDDD